MPFVIFVAKKHFPCPPSPGKGECFAQNFHSPCPGLARLCGALGHVRSIRSPLVRAQDAHGETATHAPKVMPMTTPSTARPRGGSGASFGVAGFIRGGGPPRPQARPIGHWQHWNWQHFHIGNIFTNCQKLFRARPCAAPFDLINYGHQPARLGLSGA